MEFVNEKLVEFNKYLNGKKVAIIGLGVSNISLIEYFHNLHAYVTVFDKRNYQNLPTEAKEKIEKYSIPYSLGENYLEKLKGFNMIFRSPSCRPDLPELLAEKEKGAIITSEIEMVIELTPSTVIGVTGSDGKTTTTTLIYEILKNSGYNCFIGGNIGIPLFTRNRKNETR